MLLLRQWAGINVERSRIRTEYHRRQSRSGGENRFLEFSLELVLGPFGGPILHEMSDLLQERLLGTSYQRGGIQNA